MPTINASPDIPVRVNRTIRLRRLNGVQNDRLRDLVAETRLSETDEFVKSKNKAVSKHADRRVTQWYRQQVCAVGELDRRQQGVYGKLEYLDREKRNQMKQREAGMRPRGKEHVMVPQNESDQQDCEDNVEQNLKNITHMQPDNQSANTSVDEANETRKYPKLIKIRSKYPVYRRDNRGKIVPSEVPYRKKAFHLPPLQDVIQPSPRDKIKQWMTEDEVKTERRILSFHEDLSQLAAWNPLDAVRRQHPHDDETTANPDTSNASFSVLDIFNQHHLLNGLDPNSAEALKKCRYLRRTSISMGTLAELSLSSKENTSCGIRFNVQN